jgi:hypothetical protein
MARKATELVPTMLRIREGLRKKLERAANANDWSMNMEINQRLEVSFIREDQEARDSAIVDMLAGPSHYSQQLLREIVWQLQKRPDWASSPSERREMLKRVTHYIENVGSNPLYPDFDDEDRT